MAFRRYTDVSSSLPELVGAEEIASRFDLSVPKIYDMARRGELPAHQFGRSVRFSVVDVLAYLEANKRTRGIGD